MCVLVSVCMWGGDKCVGGCGYMCVCMCEMCVISLWVDKCVYMSLSDSPFSLSLSLTQAYSP